MRVVLRYTVTGAITVVALIVLSGCRAHQPWRLALSHDGTEDWSRNWYAEGDKAIVENTSSGFVFSAGPVPGEDASHAVLWTQRSFAGDVRVEFEYTRIDTMTSVDAVNILYLQATGLGSESTPTDISETAASRAVPTMSKYYLNMNALQVSFATSGPRRSNYVSARRYPASSIPSFPTETQFEPIYEDVDLFEPGVTYQVTATKSDDLLTFAVEGSSEPRTFSWDATQFPPLAEGRIGLRHMWARSARYGNIRIYGRP